MIDVDALVGIDEASEYDAIDRRGEPRGFEIELCLNQLYIRLPERSLFCGQRHACIVDFQFGSHFFCFQDFHRLFLGGSLFLRNARRFHFCPGGLQRGLQRCPFILDEQCAGLDYISDIYQNLMYLGSDTGGERDGRVLQNLPGRSDSCFKLADFCARRADRDWK